MLVQNWMSKPVVCIGPDNSMIEATKLMKEKGIRTLPVLKKAQLVGILTDRDLKRAQASDATSLEIHELLYLLDRIKVKNIMARNPVTVPPDFTLGETAELLLARKIGGAPVVASDGTVVGMITQSDIFKAIVSLSGVGRKGVQAAFELEDRPGSIKEVVDEIRLRGGRMLSILSSYDRVPEGFRNVYIRFYGIDPPGIEDLIAAFERTGKILYLVDHRIDRRTVYRSKIE